MTLERGIARLFAMSDDVWARHANPWSVWTRTATLPVLLLALWSRAWIGWWAVLPVAAVLVWAWLNPRLFPPPRTTDTWAARATFGERLWIARREAPVPPRHRVLPHVLSAVAGIGAALALGGALTAALWPTLLGTVLVYAGKLWFLDRMVWLFEDMHGTDPRCRGWLY